jgi:hypothetical protein
MQPSNPPSSRPSAHIGSDILGDTAPPDQQGRSTSPSRQRRQPFYLNPAFIIVVVVLVILAALIGIRVVRRARAAQHQTAAVTRGTLTLSVSASGNVTAPEYNVSAVAQGTITAIDVTVGQQVSSGATLATLSYTDTRGISQTETLTAPSAGSVVAINGVVNGTPTQNSFIVIDNLAATSLTLAVNEADIAGVSVGQAVTFTAPAYANLSAPFAGTVRTISPGGQNSNNVITYPVTVAIDHASLQGANLWPQMTVNAFIITAERENVLLIPDSAPSYAQSEANSLAVSSADVNAALRQAETLLTQARQTDLQSASDDLTASYVLELHGRQLVVVPVVLGLSDGTNTEVVSGLTQGEAVVTG